MELAPLETLCNGLLTQVGAAQRRQLARQIATSLRQSQAQRIARQQDPDGNPFAARKPQLRRKKGALRRALFAKLRTAKWLKIEATPDTATVVFADQVQHMAQVHQFGLRDKVNPRGLMADYPARRLLGMTDADAQMVQDAVLAHLAAG